MTDNPDDTTIGCSLSAPSAAAWVLLAILYGSGAQGAGLRAILSAGDYLNHAILSFEELRAALGWLLAAGCIEAHSGQYVPTQIVLSAFVVIEKRQRAALKQWDALEQFLGTLQRECATGQAAAVEAGLTLAHYDQALRAYLGGCPS